MAGIKFDPSGLLSGLSDMQIRTRAALDLYGQTAAKMFEAHAKSNYPWTNRTYRASKSLHGDHMWLGSTLRITLEHGVEYGIYLEYCNNGKYAIVWPTIQALSGKALEGLRNILR